MKPLILKISAFGPYAGETVLDFSDLHSQQLFVITGPTGAGKTTVFEAMQYALFGELSKKRMDPSSLRCDFLAPSDERKTFVEFTFEVGQKSYCIYRQPKQFIPKKRGTGLREIGQEVALTCVGHTSFDPISKIAEANAKIEELLGLDVEQFKKIVMLPQGDFQKFLISETKDKMELLRDIFGTEMYAHALDLVKSRADALNKQYQTLVISYRQQLSGLAMADVYIPEDAYPSSEQIEQLQASVAFENHLLIGLKTQMQENESNRRKAEEKLLAKQQHNQQVDAWEQLLHEKKELDAKLADIQLTEERLRAVEVAQPLIYLEAQWRQVVKQLDAQKAIVVRTKEEQRLAEQNVLAADQRLQTVLQEKTQAESMEKELPFMRQQLEQLQQLKDKQLLRENAEKELGQILKSIDDNNTKMNSLEASRLQLDAKLEHFQLQQAEMHQLELDLMKLNNQRVVYLNQYQEMERYLNIAKSYGLLAQEYSEKKKSVEEANRQLQRVRELSKNNVAAMLALGLEDGQACPVCGAVHHPEIAVSQFLADGEEKQCEQILEKAKASLVAIETQQNNAKVEMQKQLVILQETDKTLVDYETVQAQKDKIIEAGLALKDEIRDKGNQQEKLAQKLSALESVKQQREQNRVAQEEATVLMRSLEDRRIRSEMLVDGLQNELHQLNEALGQLVLEQPANLANQINKLEQSIAQIKEVAQQAERQQRDASEYNIKIKARFTQEMKREEELTDSAQVLQLDWQTKLKQAFVHVEDYQRAKTDSEHKDEMRQSVENYNNQRHAVLTQCEKAEAAIENKNKVDLTLYIQAREEAIAKEDEAKNQYFAKKTCHDNNLRVVKSLQQIFEQYETGETQYKLVSTLKKLLDGDNAQKLKFETFVQSYYFDQMLHRANVRLRRMTQNRYSFMRRIGLQDGRRQAGLDIDVMDEYTGKARDVSTLSGGESFKASLSLALGLADLVTSESGGVELSTIFIDEGFGTLDDESLDTAIETLIELEESGRLVGVISHVEELKDRIHAHLVVTSGSKGSDAHFEVPQ